MYREFKVRNFRGLRKLDISSLERVNLIAGKNNVGKTALLEALFLHSCPNQAGLAHVLNEFRGLQGVNMNGVFRDIFLNFDTSADVELRAAGDWGKNERALRVSLAAMDRSQITLGSASNGEFQRAGATRKVSDERIVLEYTDEAGEVFKSSGVAFREQMGDSTQVVGIEEKRAEIKNRYNAVIMPSRHRGNPAGDAEMLSNLLVTRKQGKVEEIMRRVEPRIQGLSVISAASVPTIHAELEDHERLLPMSLLGDGVARLLSLALFISRGDAGNLALVDEIENGLHHSVMKSVWQGIAQFAREFDTQVFATTHSWECIRAAHEAFSEDEVYDFRLHRLDRVNGEGDVKAVTYEPDILEAAFRMNFEVR